MSTAIQRTKKHSQNGATVSCKPLVWSEMAPAHLAAACTLDQPESGWHIWQKHLAERATPAGFDAVGKEKSPLTWGLPDSPLSQDTIALEAALKKLRKRPVAGRGDALAQDWLAIARGASPSTALESLAWAYALPALADAMSPGVWWQILEQLTQAARDAAALETGADPLVWQWLAAELPMVLAAALPEIDGCHTLQNRGMIALGSGGERLLTEKGLPRADQLQQFDALLACWTRSLVVTGKASGDELQGVRQRLAAGLRASLALRRRDGAPLLLQGTFRRRAQQWIVAALRAADDRVTSDVAYQLEAVRARSQKKKKSARTELPLPGVQCDTARLAVLRTDWTPEATALAVRHDRAEIELELHRAGVTLARGMWSLDLLVDGERAEVERPWENVCWVSDEDVDYLEIETRLTGGVRVQRQILLARQERFLYLADAIVSADVRQLDYVSRLPLTDLVSCQPAEESREVHLHVGKQLGVALPLAQPEWRRDARGGTLAVDAGALELRQSRAGSGLNAPLWIDLDRKRSRKPLTWRQLTIAQDRRAAPADTAVGYRVQIGRKQWLIYRSLGPRANRTLLGSNLVSEFMLARFTPEGEAEPLLEIE